MGHIDDVPDDVVPRMGFGSALTAADGARKHTHLSIQLSLSRYGRQSQEWSETRLIGKRIVESFVELLQSHLTKKDQFMTKVNLSDYNLSELKGLQAEIEKNIKARQHQEVTKAREQILTIAQTLGVSVEELLATGGAKGSGKKVQAQYQNPVDSAQRWTGRGRQPKWIAEGLAGGKSLDDFRI